MPYHVPPLYLHSPPGWHYSHAVELVQWSIWNNIDTSATARVTEAETREQGGSESSVDGIDEEVEAAVERTGVEESEGHNVGGVTVEFTSDDDTLLFVVLSTRHLHYNMWCRSNVFMVEASAFT